MELKDLIAPKNFNLVSKFEKHAADQNRIALIVLDEQGEDQKVTYSDLLGKAYQVAQGFLAKGLKKGDRLLVMLPKSLEAYVCYIAALKVGIIVLPCSDQLREREVDYRIRHSEAKAIIYHEKYENLFSHLDSFKEIDHLVITDDENDERSIIHFSKKFPKTMENEVEVQSDDIAFISYTSGTTGTPKGVIHHHAWGFAHLKTTGKNWLGIEEGDVVWATAAPGWQKWIWSPLLATLGSGATAIVYKGKFEPNRYMQIIEDYQVQVLCCTPTEYRMMAKSESFGTHSFEKLKSAVSAGEPLNREVINQFKDKYGVTIRDGYGQTENTLLVGTMLNMEQKIGSMGKPTPGNIVEIIDGNGEILPPGQVGDIAVHIETPALFRGYHREPERTAMQFRGDWYVTGDRARKDEDGYFWFEGRADDMIITAGYTIGPFDIEDALLRHEKVSECAVVASPDEVRGSVVKAFIVLKDFEMTKEEGIVEEIQNFVKNQVAPYSYPRKIEFLEELPKTLSGKIRRAELRKREQGLI